MTVHILKLSNDNSDVLRNLADDVFDHEIIPAQLHAFLDDPRHVLYVAQDDDTVVGMASAFEYFQPDKQPQLFINEVGVAPTHQNRGVGRQLISALIETAKNRGCVFAWLGTENDNLRAQACFAAVPGGAEPQPFLLYEWQLAD